MRKTVKIPRILSIEKIEGLQVYVVFNNGETRKLDFLKLLAEWNVEENDIEYKLFNEKEFQKVTLRNQTLSWENLATSLIDENGQEAKYPYEIGADVLYKHSEQTELSVNSYGDLVRTERIKAGMTQDELAHKAGTTRFYISRFENNKSNIELSTLRRIVESGLGKKLQVQITG
jgi:DNA-binding XRE family transcriptional regulator